MHEWSGLLGGSACVQAKVRSSSKITQNLGTSSPSGSCGRARATATDSLPSTISWRCSMRLCPKMWISCTRGCTTASYCSASSTWQTPSSHPSMMACLTRISTWWFWSCASNVCLGFRAYVFCFFTNSFPRGSKRQTLQCVTLSHIRCCWISLKSTLS